MLPPVPDRKLIAAVAGCAVLFVALMMLGPGRERPVLSARFFGGAMAEGARQTSFRLVLVRREGGSDEKVGGRALHVALTRADGEQALWEGKTGRDGTAEVTVTWEGASPGPVHVHVKDTEGQTLAEGELPARPPSWGPSEPSRSELRGHVKGELAIRAAALRGALAAPFPEEIVIEVRHEGVPVEKAHVKVSSVGAVIASHGSEEAGASRAPGSVTLKTGRLGRARIRVQPMSHDAELAIEASLGELSGSFEARLPVVPGAMWLEPASLDAQARTIYSPVSRKEAYVSVATPHARLFGATVPLREDGRGHAIGSFDLGPVLPSLRAESPVYVTIASGLGFDGAGTIGWPLIPDDDAFEASSYAFRDVLLLDGMPERIAAERERRRRAAWFSALVLALAAAIEAWLLVRASRGASLATAALGEESSLKIAPARFGAHRLAIAIVITVIAFAAVGALVLWQALS